MLKTVVVTKLEKCNETHFSDTEYEENFYKAYKDDETHYCIKKDDPIQL